MKQGENYRRFCEAVRDAVRHRLGHTYQVSLHSVTKNNNVRLESLLIGTEKTSVMPAVYLNDFYRSYQNGADWEDVISGILQLYETNRNFCYDSVSFAYEDVQEDIFYRLVNYERNKESLEAMPHYRVGGYAIVFHCMVLAGEERAGNIRLTTEHMKYWGISKEELLRRACANSARLQPTSLRPMAEVMKELMRQDVEACASAEEVPMYVLTNDSGNYGASALLDIELLDRFAAALSDDFYILPSSVHEVLLLPLHVAPQAERIAAMVREINETQVPEMEYLSDDVLLYSEFRALLPGQLFSAACAKQ